jgi:hypothetical protein
MFLATLDSPWLGPANPYLNEGQEMTLASATESLARLRFSIILTARWEAEESEDTERRSELRDELAHLRMQYFDRIDEIAMTFGVQQAMNAQAEVESTVTVPRDVRLPELMADSGDFLL